MSIACAGVIAAVFRVLIDGEQSRTPHLGLIDKIYGESRAILRTFDLDPEFGTPPLPPSPPSHHTSAGQHAYQLHDWCMIGGQEAAATLLGSQSQQLMSAPIFLGMCQYLSTVNVGVCAS